MKELTVHELSEELAEALNRESERRCEPLEQTVIHLLAEGLGLRQAERRSNGLRQLAGRWTDEELGRFEAAVAEATEDVDPGLWG